MGKEVSLSIEKAPVDFDGKLEQRKKLASLLENKLKDFEKELDSKSYLIEGKTEIAKSLLDFVINEAEWKFSESMGVLESVRQLESAVKDLESGKRKELLLPNLAIEAIYYFMTKKTGVGLASAQEYFKLLKPVTDALQRARIDKDKKDQLIKDLGTVQHAIDSGATSEHEDKLLAEIEAETAQ
jgi:hypothetical protein